MTLTQFLARFPDVTTTRKGWDVCCPAHEDHHPSLGILEGDDGKIVLNCFAGCTPASICAALGLTVADLFQDRPVHGRPEPWVPIPKKMLPIKLAFAYDLHALDLRLAADKILEAAQACGGCETWSDVERDLAMDAVAKAYAYQDRARFCEDYADHLREVDCESRQTRAREQAARHPTV